MGKVKNIEQYGWNGLKAQKLLAQGNGHNQHALTFALPFGQRFSIPFGR